MLEFFIQKEGYKTDEVFQDFKSFRKGLDNYEILVSFIRKRGHTYFSISDEEMEDVEKEMEIFLETMKENPIVDYSTTFDGNYGSRLKIN